MVNLKVFLKYRDNFQEFEKVKEEGRVGLPCIVVNKGEEILFDHDELEI